MYLSFVGWISTSVSTEYDRVRLVYNLDECRTRCYVLVDALALIHPTWLSKALIGHTALLRCFKITMIARCASLSFSTSYRGILFFASYLKYLKIPRVYPKMHDNTGKIA